MERWKRGKEKKAKTTRHDTKIKVLASPPEGKLSEGSKRREREREARVLLPDVVLRAKRAST